MIGSLAGPAGSMAESARLLFVSGSYLYMDPLEEAEGLVPLSKFGNRIYAVRYVDWKR